MTFESEGVVGTFVHGGCGTSHFPGDPCPAPCGANWREVSRIACTLPAGHAGSHIGALNGSTSVRWARDA